MCSMTYPSLILAYTGQASFLRVHNNLVGDTFYKSVPGPFGCNLLLKAYSLIAIIRKCDILKGQYIHK